MQLSTFSITLTFIGQPILKDAYNQPQNDYEEVMKTFNSSAAGSIHAFVCCSKTLQPVNDSILPFEIHRSLEIRHVIVKHVCSDFKALRLWVIGSVTQHCLSAGKLRLAVFVVQQIIVHVTKGTSHMYQ